MSDPIKRDDALATIDTFKRDFEQSWKVQFSADIKALPAVDPVVIHQVDPAAIREAALREAAEKATARWAARRKHADQLAEMDYPEAAIDAKTVSAKADEAEMIAEEILALIGEKK